MRMPYFDLISLCGPISFLYNFKKRCIFVSNKFTSVFVFVGVLRETLRDRVHQSSRGKCLHNVKFGDFDVGSIPSRETIVSITNPGYSWPVKRERLVTPLLKGVALSGAHSSCYFDSSFKFSLISLHQGFHKFNLGWAVPEDPPWVTNVSEICPSSNFLRWCDIGVNTLKFIFHDTK
jgi:hypothetical protein